MEQHLAKMDNLALPRKVRFPMQFTDDINTLVSLLTKDIVERYNNIQVMVYNMMWCFQSLCKIVRGSRQFLTVF